MLVGHSATSAATTGSAYLTLRERIRSCELHPGHLLTEGQITADLAASAAAVRGAFAMLAQDGLIGRAPGGGYQVSAPTLKSVDDLFVAWRLIGPELVRLGVNRASAGQLRTMREIVADDGFFTGQSAHARISWFYAHAIALFELFAAASDSEQLTDSLGSLADDMSRIWYLPVAEAARSGGLRSFDNGLGAALDQRDGDLAAERARDFITSTHARARRLARSCDMISLDSERARRGAEGVPRAAEQVR